MTEMIETFIFEHDDLKSRSTEFPIMIPYDGNVKELSSIFLNNNDIPVYLQNGNN